MLTYIHTCERCGNEKEIFLDPGQKLEDIKCQCKAPGPSSKSYLDISTIDTFSHSEHSCGCGSNCGCH